MNILNKLTKKNLLLNKQRSIVTVVGIVLSCALITAVFSLVTSLQKTLLEYSIINDGNRHVTFSDVPFEETKYITNHVEVDKSYLTNESLIKLEINNTDIYNEEYGAIIGIEKEGLNDLENALDEGKVPTNESEIAVNYFTADQLDIEIGDTISIEKGKLVDAEGIEVEYDYYSDGTETFITTEIIKYKVVGFVKYSTFLRSNYVHNFYTYEEEITTNANVHVLYKNPENYDKITAEINGTSKDTDQGKYNYYYNREYLRWGGYSTSDNTQSALYLVAGIVSLIIIGTSIFCIRNSFAISMTEKTRLYGMLSSVGATSKQIKKTVLKEGFYLGVIGIPVGIIFGILAAYILVFIINYLIVGDISEMIFLFKISLESVVISIVLTIITIYLSAIGSARKAAKITEIEAIKNQKEIKIKNKKIKCPKYIGNIFKIGGVFAYKNMKRNKSKFRTTIISLAVSVATFISLSYFMLVGYGLTSDYYKVFNYNIEVIRQYDSRDMESYLEIAKNSLIDKYSIIRTANLQIDLEEVNSDMVDNEKLAFMAENIYIKTVNDEEYKRFLDKLGYNYYDYQDKGIVLNNEIEMYTVDNTINNVKIIDEKLTQITLKDFHGNEIDKLDIEFIETEETVLGMEGTLHYDVTVLVSEKYYEEKNLDKNDYGYINGLYIYTEDPRTLQTEIYEYAENNEIDVSVFNIEEYIEMQNNLMLLIAIFAYGFIIVIILIGLTNIFNTITTNMMLRSKEFAILKSIGMTKKEFKNMIRLESIFYGLKSLLWGITIGLILSYLLYLALNSASEYGQVIVESYEIPWLPIIIAIIFVFLVISLIMKLSMSKINKQNIIETIKNENI